MKLLFCIFKTVFSYRAVFDILSAFSGFQGIFSYFDILHSVLNVNVITAIALLFLVMHT